jgi:hypothetical protein
MPVPLLTLNAFALAFIQDMHGVCTGPLQRPVSGERSDRQHLRFGLPAGSLRRPVNGELAELSNHTKKVE